MYNELIKGYSSVGDIFLFVLCGLLLVIARDTFIKQERTTKIFIHALMILPLGCLANVMTAVAIRSGWGSFTILLFRDIYHSALLCLFFFYEFYMITIIGFEKKSYKRCMILASTVNLFGIIFDCISPLTHIGLYCDEFGVWHDSVWVKPYSLCYAINVIFLAVLILSRKDRLIRKVRRILILTQGLCVLIVVIESVFEHNSFMALSFSLPLFSVLTLLHSNAYNLSTGSLGDRAFDDYLQERTNKKKKDVFLCIRFYTEETFTMPKELGKLFYSFYYKFVNDGILFNPTNGCYILAIKEEKNQDAISAAEKMVYEEFPKRYEKFKINYRILVLENPNVVSQQQFIDLFYHSLRNSEMNSTTFLYEKDYEEYNKAQYVLSQLNDIAEKNDLEDERVMVFLQPIKNVELDIFDTAEALMRLQLPEMGMVFPDMFIPLAESAGMIHNLTLIILNKTCKLAGQLIKEGYRINRLSINVSDTELDSNSFVKEFESIVSNNEIPFDKIGVELTESRNDSDYSMVQSIIADLKALGTPIYLDDFGTGYSNFERILKLNFDVIKFDRSLLLMADQNEEYRKLIRYLAEAFANLGYKVLYEGVETEEHVKNCTNASANYLQGYHFSKPVPMNQIREFFVKN